MGKRRAEEMRVRLEQAAGDTGEAFAIAKEAFGAAGFAVESGDVALGIELLHIALQGCPASGDWPSSGLDERRR